jgi:hypothetical protein
MEKASTSSIEGWLGPKSVEGFGQGINFFPIPGLEPQFLGRLARGLVIIRPEKSCLQGQTAETTKNVDQNKCINFLGAFTKLRKATISFDMPACLSVRPHGITWLPLEGFSYNLIFGDFFENLSIKFNFHYNLTRIMGNVHEDRNVSDKICKENQNTFYVQ